MELVRVYLQLPAVVLLPWRQLLRERQGKEGTLRRT
jgi:hypothetical protein